MRLGNYSSKSASYRFFSFQILAEIARSFPCLSLVPSATASATGVAKARYILNFETQRTYARSLMKQQDATSSGDDGNDDTKSRICWRVWFRLSAKIQFYWQNSFWFEYQQFSKISNKSCEMELNSSKSTNTYKMWREFLNFFLIIWYVDCCCFSCQFYCSLSIVTYSANFHFSAGFLPVLIVYVTIFNFVDFYIHLDNYLFPVRQIDRDRVARWFFFCLDSPSPASQRK